MGDTDIFYFNFQCQVKLVFWTDFIFLQHCLPVVVISIADSNEMNKQLFFLFNFFIKFHLYIVSHTFTMIFNNSHLLPFLSFLSQNTFSSLFCLCFSNQKWKCCTERRSGRGFQRLQCARDTSHVSSSSVSRLLKWLTNHIRLWSAPSSLTCMHTLF